MSPASGSFAPCRHPPGLRPWIPLGDFRPQTAGSAPPPLIISKPATAVCGINAFTAQGGDAHKSWEITLFGVFTDAEPASAPLSHARDCPACSKRRSFAHVYTQRRVTRGTDILSPSNHRKIASIGLQTPAASVGAGD